MPLRILEAAEVVPEVVPKRLEVVLKMPEVVLYMLEVVNCVRCVVWVLGIMLCMLFCMLLCILEAVEGSASCKCWKLCSMCCRCGDVLCATRPRTVYTVC